MISSFFSGAGIWTGLFLTEVKNTQLTQGLQVAKKANIAVQVCESAEAFAEN